MDTAVSAHRFQFAFTITYHYLFPQLTMGLALLIVILKILALRTQNPRYDESARTTIHDFSNKLNRTRRVNTS